MPRYDEFKAKDVWAQIKDNEVYSIYFKEYSEKAYPDRTYMYNSNFNPPHNKDENLYVLNFIVINTVGNGKILNLIKEAEMSRKKDFEKEHDGEFIEIGNEIYKLLKLTPIYNSIKHFFINHNYLLF